jgi:hypothetical protein
MLRDLENISFDGERYKVALTLLLYRSTQNNSPGFPAITMAEFIARNKTEGRISLSVLNGLRFVELPPAYVGTIEFHRVVSLLKISPVQCVLCK